MRLAQGPRKEIGTESGPNPGLTTTDPKWEVEVSCKGDPLPFGLLRTNSYELPVECFELTNPNSSKGYICCFIICIYNIHHVQIIFMYYNNSYFENYQLKAKQEGTHSGHDERKQATYEVQPQCAHTLAIERVPRKTR